MMLDTAAYRVNTPPAPTWHRLRMNGTVLREDLPAHAQPATIESSGFIAHAPADAFERAIAHLQARIGDSRNAACDAPADEKSLDAPALSSYQRHVAHREARGDIAEAFRTGAGPEARSLAENLAGARRVLATAPHTHDATAFVHLESRDGRSCACALDIVVAHDCTARVTLLFDGASESEELLGSSIRIFCGARSQVVVTVIQACEHASMLLDDSGCILDDDARIDVEHYALSAGESFTGFACDLRGSRSEARTQLHYLATGEADLDFNYEFDHHGTESTSDLNADGVLADEGTKTLKATIDFVRGCKGARGHEQETALISGERAHNRSCPVILCGEDDVSGDHGATIGHVNADQMFYLACRGLDAEAA
ncbi:MAG: SufD family Fe-S cluster assembly protein, partial [Slackia sp.]|nr:SufD family Fe-S cluster assembly protein [Slackia sp.]